MKIGKIILLFIITFFLSGGKAFSQNLVEADSAYNVGDYNLAIQLYSETATNVGISAPLLFNLGNAYYETGDYGNAMLCYQRAYRLDPSEKRIKDNMVYLKGKIEDINKGEQKGKRLSVVEDEPTFFQMIHQNIARDVASNAWAVWAAIFFGLFLVCVCFYVFTGIVVLRKIGFFGGFTFLSLCFLCLICSYLSLQATQSMEEGVLTAYKTPLLTQPASGTDENNIGTLTQGTTVRIVSEEKDASGKVTWYKVRLNSDYIGWIPAEDVEIIGIWE